MRDYLQLFWTKDSMPWIPTVVTQYYFFATAAECQAFVDANPVSPGGGTLSPVSTVWFRLNKAITLGYINNANVTNIGDGGTPVLDGQNKQMIFLGDSPRDLGINSRVEKKGFKASQTGNVILPDAIAQEIAFLTSFANKLLRSRVLNDQRNGSIILSELRKSFLGTQTFTQTLINIQPILDQYK